ncbi:MAG: DMT family transporter [Bacillota bacterium]|nr:DMT family transporter [Bacillota bacterium]
MSQEENRRPWWILLALLCTALWGSAFATVKTGYRLFSIAATDTASILVFAGARFTLAGFTTLLLAASGLARRGAPAAERHVWLPRKEQWLGLLILGVIQCSLQYLFLYVGQANSSGTTTSILNACGSFTTIILAHLFQRGDRLDHRSILGILSGFLGVIVLNLRGVTVYDGLGSLFSFRLRGEGLVLCATVCGSIGNLLTKRLTASVDPLVLTGWKLGMGGSLSLVTGLAAGGRLLPTRPGAWLLLLYLGLLSVIAFNVWTWLLKRRPLSQMASLLALIPIFGVLFSGILLGESLLNPLMLLSLALILLGVQLINARFRSRGRAWVRREE